MRKILALRTVLSAAGSLMGHCQELPGNQVHLFMLLSILFLPMFMSNAALTLSRAD
jgi:hypothetical protein